ncbi:trypsin-1 [Scaptodrosophila lebanonensis]|uniref:Trypsin-1 n=1 Tax=Drosophila lebanonensis TaxID=7225 RepID=A0A6J2TFU0_DROLE|nr:trypsin-1 [Scaptodrosophila lebanonensis]
MMHLKLIWILAAVNVPLSLQLQSVQDLANGISNNFLEWLASIFLPINTTTARPVTNNSKPTTPSTTTTKRTTTAIAINLDPTERECSVCLCGLINTLRIVGGQETRRHQYPWVAVVLLNSRFYCSGSLINDLYVLTAAHCVKGVPVELIEVRLLEHSRSQKDAFVVRRFASHVKTHEFYSPVSFDNDIALIRLDRPVPVDGTLRPICMPVPGYSFEGELGIVTGWGVQAEGGLASDTLREVSVVIITQAECRNSSYSESEITDNMICAGDLAEGGKDACTGDSGSPLHVPFEEEPGQYQLAGIVSWGDGCARPNTPGVYTRVNRYLRWIGANIHGACLCTPYPEEDL